MANLTKDRNTETIPATLQQPQLGPYGVPAAAVVYRGLMYTLDSSARPKNPGAVNEVVVGVNITEKLDNTSGANDALKTAPFTGVFKFDLHGTNPPTAADVLKPGYASDNHTISRTAADGSYAGVIVMVDTDGVWIWIGPATSSQRPCPIASGSAVLVAGTVTVATALAKTGSVIMLTPTVAGGAQGVLRVSAISDGVSFTITSASGTDTSTVQWAILA